MKYSMEGKKTHSTCVCVRVQPVLFMFSVSHFLPELIANLITPYGKVVLNCACCAV